MEGSHPEVVAAMLAKAAAFGVLGDDGISRSMIGGRAVPPEQRHGLSKDALGAAAGHGAANRGVRPSVGRRTIGQTGYAGPYMAEGPAAMLEMIREEPTGAY